MLFLYNLYIAYLLLQIPYRNLTIDYYYIVTVFYMSHIFDHWLPLELLFHIFLMHMMSLQCRHADVYAGARRAADGPPSCIETVAPIRYHPSSDRADRLARDLARGGCRSTAVAYAKARAWSEAERAAHDASRAPKIVTAHSDLREVATRVDWCRFGCPRDAFASRWAQPQQQLRARLRTTPTKSSRP